MNFKSFIHELKNSPEIIQMCKELLIGAALTAGLVAIMMLAGWLDQFA